MANMSDVKTVLYESGAGGRLVFAHLVQRGGMMAFYSVRCLAGSHFEAYPFKHKPSLTALTIGPGPLVIRT